MRYKFLGNKIILCKPKLGYPSLFFIGTVTKIFYQSLNGDQWRSYISLVSQDVFN